MKYEVPSYEIYMLNTADVIATSAGGEGGGGDWDTPFMP